MSTQELDSSIPVPSSNRNPPFPAQVKVSDGLEHVSCRPGLLRYDEQGRVREVDARTSELTRSGREALLGRAWPSLFVGLSHPATSLGVGETLEVELLCSDGTSLPALLVGASVSPDAGGLMFVFDRRRSDREQAMVTGLRRRLREIEQLAHLGTAVCHLADDRVELSEEMRRMFGFAAHRSEAPVEEMMTHMHPEDRDAARDAYAALRCGGPSPNLEIRVLREDGSSRHLDFRGETVLDDEGLPIAIFNTAHDITDLKLAQESISRNERRLSEAQKMANVGSWELEIASNQVTWSDQLFRMFGVERGDVEPSYESFQKFVHPDDLKGVVARIDAAFQQGVPVEYDNRIVRPDGSIRYNHSKNEVVLDGHGRPDRLIGTVQDVTEQREAEQALHESEARLLHAQKLEAVGRLAGGVAHDFNNLLTAIIGYTELAARQLAPDSPVRVDLEQIRQAGGRAAALTRQLLAFSRRQVLAPRQIAIHTVINDLAPMLQLVIGEDIALSTRLEDGDAHVFADPGQIEQVVMNLAVNARDAMPNGGILSVTTRRIDLPPGHGSNAENQGGSYVEMMIGDTGTGIDPEVLGHLFEPFFTTKELGKGTGLGLATVYGIVQQSGGFIEVESEVGLGTRFRVLLPKVDLRCDPDAVSAMDDRLRGHETVLLVEDEPQVRQVTRRMLELGGYHVLEASNGLEAARVASRHPDAIHLLVTDVVMPGLNGREVAEQITLARPSTRVLYISGYTDDAAVLRTALKAGAPFVHKPFTHETLIRKVREILDRPA